jgi:hypothetical protein
MRERWPVELGNEYLLTRQSGSPSCEQARWYHVRPRNRRRRDPTSRMERDEQDRRGTWYREAKARRAVIEKGASLTRKRDRRKYQPKRAAHPKIMHVTNHQPCPVPEISASVLHVRSKTKEQQEENNIMFLARFRETESPSTCFGLSSSISCKYRQRDL